MITIFQVIVSLIIIVLVLFQERSSGLSGVLGGGGGGGSYQTRRGLEKVIYWATIGLGVVFAGLALLNLIQSS